MNPVLVINPHDGRRYDVAPIFDYIHEERMSFQELSDQCQGTGDMIVQIIDPGHTAFLDSIKNSCYFLSNLREVFKKVRAVD